MHQCLRQLWKLETIQLSGIIYDVYYESKTYSIKFKHISAVLHINDWTYWEEIRISVECLIIHVQ